jgi:hypothetical protein
MTDSRISIYIVTYRNSVDLNNNIASILASGVRASICVINNHSEFHLKPEHERAVAVLHNSLRPDFSTGHLARSWNQALLHGFRDLNRPASDIVVTVQDDVIFRSDWFINLIDLHRRYSFITMGVGDAFCSYLPEAVKKVGMWDERFCSIGYQEGDYFLRSLIHNRDGCSINDPGHGRMNNAVGENTYHEREGDFSNNSNRSASMLVTSPHWNQDRKNAHIFSARCNHALSEAFFKHKWGVSSMHWSAEHHAIRSSLITNYITYPYFEKDVESLREKNYFLPEEDSVRRWADRLAHVD